MRTVVQRVSRASVTMENVVVGAIDRGLLVLIGVTHADTEANQYGSVITETDRSPRHNTKIIILYYLRPISELIKDRSLLRPIQP